MNNIIHVIARCDANITTAVAGKDIRLFKSLPHWHSVMDKEPAIIQDVYIFGDVVPFTASNIDTVLEVVNSSFFQYSGKVTFVYPEQSTVDNANKFFIERLKNDTFIAIKGGTSYQEILGILNGSLRMVNEGEVHIKTYRMRADEYAREQNIKKYQTDDDSKFFSDDEEWVETYEDEALPEIEIDYTEQGSNLRMVSLYGNATPRTEMAVILAQFLAKSGRTVLVERDTEFHTLATISSTLSVRKTIVFYEDIESDVNEALRRICESPTNLVLILCKDRYPIISYDFILTLLLNKAKGAVSFLITENDIVSITNTTRGFIILENNLPSILQGINDLPEDTPIDKCRFVAVSTKAGHQLALGPRKTRDLVMYLTGTQVMVESYKLDGLDLQKGEAIHDLQVLFRRNHRS